MATQAMEPTSWYEESQEVCHPSSSSTAAKSPRVRRHCAKAIRTLFALVSGLVLLTSTKTEAKVKYKRGITQEIMKQVMRSPTLSRPKTRFDERPLRKGWSDAKVARCEFLFRRIQDEEIKNIELEKVVDELRLENMFSSAGDFTAVFNALARRPTRYAVDTTLLLLEDMRRMNIMPNVVTYSAAIQVCCKEKSWWKSLGLLRQMRREEVTPNVVTYNVAIDSLTKAKHWVEALEVFSQAQESGLPLTEVTYASAINACRGGRLWELALHITQQMRDSGLRGNKVTWTSLIQAAEDGGEHALAMQLFGEMKSARFQPDKMTYTIMLRICRKRGLWKRAVYLLEKMQKQGLELTAADYGALIGACSGPMTADAGAPDVALKFYAEMKQKGLVPSPTTFAAVANALEEMGRSNETVALLENQLLLDRGELEKAPLASAFTFAAGIKACRNMEDWERLLTFFRDMRERNLFEEEFTIVSDFSRKQGPEEQQSEEDLTALQVARKVLRTCYGGAVEALMNLQRPGEAVRLIGELVRRGIRVNPNLLQGCLERLLAIRRDGKAHEQGAAISDENIVTEKEPKTILWQVVGTGAQELEWAIRQLYPTLVCSLARVSQSRRALRALRTMKGYMRPGWRQYHDVMTAMKEEGEYVKLPELLAEMRSMDIQPGTDTVVTVMEALMNQVRWDESLLLLQQLRSEGRGNVKAYEVGLEACEKSQKPEEALELLSWMSEHELTPSALCYDSAMKACRNSGRREEADQLLAKMQAAGITPIKENAEAEAEAMRNRQDRVGAVSPWSDGDDGGQLRRGPSPRFRQRSPEDWKETAEPEAQAMRSRQDRVGAVSPWSDGDDGDQLGRGPSPRFRRRSPEDWKETAEPEQALRSRQDRVGAVSPWSDGDDGAQLGRGSSPRFRYRSPADWKASE